MIEFHRYSPNTAHPAERPGSSLKRPIAALAIVGVLFGLLVWETPRFGDETELFNVFLD